MNGLLSGSILWVVGAYLIGAIPTGLLAGRLLRGIDLRQHGSGNLGATNVFRTLGPGPAIAVLLVDSIKGFAPVFWIPELSGATGSTPDRLLVFRLLLGFGAIAGHVFSPFVRFRGGKGVATAAGVFLALAPRALGLCVVIWALLMAAFRIVSVASICAALALPLTVYATTGGGSPGDWFLRGFSVLICLAVLYTHRANISRLLRGEEKRLSRGGQGEGRT